MAKKASKKAAKKKPAKPAKKAPASKAAARKSAGKPAGRNPFPVNTGSGPSAAEIGRDIVAMFNRGELHEIEDKYWSRSVVSVEGDGVNLAWSGRAAVEEKNAGWSETHRMHGASAEGPYIGSSGFAIKFSIDVEDTSTGSRTLMEEVGVYQISDGKIIREEFMYGRSAPVVG